jgi:hypothetical protein
MIITIRTTRVLYAVACRHANDADDVPCYQEGPKAGSRLEAAECAAEDGWEETYRGDWVCPAHAGKAEGYAK